MEVRSVGNSQSLKETALIEAFNLKVMGHSERGIIGNIGMLGFTGECSWRRPCWITWAPWLI